jgi:hypothetical protein
VLTVWRADAALAASLFHDGKLEIPDLKRYLAEAGSPSANELVGVAMNPGQRWTALNLKFDERA